MSGAEENLETARHYIRAIEGRTIAQELEQSYFLDISVWSFWLNLLAMSLQGIPALQDL
jgi:hypothetical protein